MKESINSLLYDYKEKINEKKEKMKTLKEEYQSIKAIITKKLDEYFSSQYEDFISDALSKILERRENNLRKVIEKHYGDAYKENYSYLKNILFNKEIESIFNVDNEQDNYVFSTSYNEKGILDHAKKLIGEEKTEKNCNDSYSEIKSWNEHTLSEYNRNIYNALSILKNNPDCNLGEVMTERMILSLVVYSNYQAKALVNSRDSYAFFVLNKERIGKVAKEYKMKFNPIKNTISITKKDLEELLNNSKKEEGPKLTHK